MELTQPIIHKRPQPHAGAGVSSLAHQPTPFFAVDSFQQLPFDYEPSFPQDSLSYGQTSSFESQYTSQSEPAPAKRRKLDTNSPNMPPRYSDAVYQDNSEKVLGLNLYETNLNEQQSMLSRWAEPVIPNSQSLAQFPRRMAELICGGCGSDDQPDGYFSLPEEQPEVCGPSRPYSVEKPPMIGTRPLPEQTSAFALVDAKGLSHGIFSDSSTLANPTHPIFAHSSQLQTTPEFIQEGFMCSHEAAFPTFFPDQLVKQEPDLGSSPIFGQESLIQSSQPQVTYGFDVLNASVAQPMQQANMSPISAPGQAMLMSAGSLIDAMPQEPWNNTSVQVQPSNFDILLPNQRGGKRGPFRDPSLREQTAQTRKIGSCIRCRMQRIRCEHNPNEPGGACLTCKKVSNTKAGRFPCLRYKITDIRLFKPGQVPGYEWTRRWNNNISDPIQTWASPDVKLIRISAGYSTRSIELTVRKFVPQDGDKLERTWDFEGTKRSVQIPAYALMNLDDGKSAYMKHIEDAMGDTLQYVAERSSGLLRSTYIEAFKMYQDASIPLEWKNLFNWTFRLWVSIRLSTTSEFIVGDEKLGMPDDILDSTNPNSGKIPVPPVLGAQLDLVLIHHIQTRLRRELLDKLQKMVLKNKQDTWFVTYLVTFMLLHNAALITAHDAAYARKHGIRVSGTKAKKFAWKGFPSPQGLNMFGVWPPSETVVNENLVLTIGVQRRFAREDKVKEYHLGANILLAHFHYCNKGWYPFSDDCKDQDLRTLADLSDDKIQFVHAARKFAREHKREWDQLREQGAWEDDDFFVSQLFEENWHPRSDA